VGAGAGAAVEGIGSATGVVSFVSSPQPAVTSNAAAAIRVQVVIAFAPLAAPRGPSTSSERSACRNASRELCVRYLCDERGEILFADEPRLLPASRLRALKRVVAVATLAAAPLSLTACMGAAMPPAPPIPTMGQVPRPVPPPAATPSASASVAAPPVPPPPATPVHPAAPPR
jgi:hypothetical protein